MSSYTTGNDHRLDSVSKGRMLGQGHVDVPPSQSVQLAQKKEEKKGGPWSRAIIGDPESSTHPPQEQTIELTPVERPQRARGSQEERRYNLWRERQLRQGRPVE